MSSSISNDLAGLVDGVASRAIQRKRALSQQASETKKQMSIINKAIHAAGGEAQVFHKISAGVTVSKLCEILGVSQGGFYDWVERVPERRETLTRARELAAHALADQTLEIADSATPEDVQVAKLRTDIRLKLAARHNRAYFGEAQAPLVNIDMGSLALEALRRRDV